MSINCCLVTKSCPWNNGTEYLKEYVVRIYYGMMYPQLLQSFLTLVTRWTVACQAPLYMGFLSQEYWSGLPFPSPESLRNPGIQPRSPPLQADSL